MTKQALNNFQMLVDGGTAGMFWSYIWVIIGQFFIVVSLAEMASMAPTAGGSDILTVARANRIS